MNRTLIFSQRIPEKINMQLPPTAAPPGNPTPLTSTDELLYHINMLTVLLLVLLSASTTTSHCQDLSGRIKITQKYASLEIEWPQISQTAQDDMKRSLRCKLNSFGIKRYIFSLLAELGYLFLPDTQRLNWYPSKPRGFTKMLDCSFKVNPPSNQSTVVNLNVDQMCWLKT